MKVRCQFCDLELGLTAPGTFHRVTGWVEATKRGGGTRLPGPAVGYACRVCLDLAERKGPAQSETLF
jgi:hypothetical protein